MYSPKKHRRYFIPYVSQTSRGRQGPFFIAHLGHKIRCPQVTCKPHLHQLLRIHLPASLMPLSNAPLVFLQKTSTCCPNKSKERIATYCYLQHELQPLQAQQTTLPQAMTWSNPENRKTGPWNQKTRVAYGIFYKCILLISSYGFDFRCFFADSRIPRWIIW